MSLYLFAPISRADHWLLIMSNSLKELYPDWDCENVLDPHNMLQAEAADIGMELSYNTVFNMEVEGPSQILSFVETALDTPVDSDANVLDGELPYPEFMQEQASVPCRTLPIEVTHPRPVPSLSSVDTGLDILTTPACEPAGWATSSAQSGTYTPRPLLSADTHVIAPPTRAVRDIHQPVVHPAGLTPMMYDSVPDRAPLHAAHTSAFHYGPGPPYQTHLSVRAVLPSMVPRISQRPRIRPETRHPDSHYPAGLPIAKSHQIHSSPAVPGPTAGPSSSSAEKDSATGAGCQERLMERDRCEFKPESSASTEALWQSGSGLSGSQSRGLKKEKEDECERRAEEGAETKCMNAEDAFPTELSHMPPDVKDDKPPENASSDIHQQKIWGVKQKADSDHATISGRKQRPKGNHPCSLCDNDFTRLHDLQRHLRTKHFEPGTVVYWRSPVCYSRFVRSDAANRHLRTVHPDAIDRHEEVVLYRATDPDEHRKSDASEEGRVKHAKRCKWASKGRKAKDGKASGKDGGKEEWDIERGM